LNLVDRTADRIPSLGGKLFASCLAGPRACPKFLPSGSTGTSSLRSIRASAKPFPGARLIAHAEAIAGRFHGLGPLAHQSRAALRDTAVPFRLFVPHSSPSWGCGCHCELASWLAELHVSHRHMTSVLWPYPRYSLRSRLGPPPRSLLVNGSQRRWHVYSSTSLSRPFDNRCTLHRHQRGSL
jgi:hypothetical protein